MIFIFSIGNFENKFRSKNLFRKTKISIIAKNENFENFQNLETIWDSRNIYKISRFPNRFEILKIFNFRKIFLEIYKKNSKFRINLDLDHHIWKRI
jgi:hypothetical protein